MGKHIFKITWNEGLEEREVKANHPDEVWGEIFPTDYRLDHAEIAESRLNPEYKEDYEVSKV